MCQRLYIASKYMLPETGAAFNSPFPVVSPLPEEAAAVRRWFARDAVHFAEARPDDGCGCGWPESRAGVTGPAPADGVAAALVAYLSQLPAKRCIAELLLTRAGEENAKPKNSREISLAELARPGFAFRQGEILRVRADLKN